MSILTTAPRLCALLLALGAIGSQADVLRLANGDQLQGRLLAHDAGQIRWESPILGVVTIPESQATIVADAFATTPPPNAGSSSTTTDVPGKQLTRKLPVAESPPPSASPPRVTTIESGLTIQSGRSDRADINFRAETTFEGKSNAVRIQARYLYSKADGTVTTDRSEAAVRWRRELSEQWFGQTISSFYSSKIKGIDHNLEQNAGFGYRLIKTERTSASLGAGLTSQYREVVDAGTGRSLFGEVFQDFAIKLSPRLDLGEDFTVHYSPSGRGLRVLPSGQAQFINTDVTNYKVTLKAFLRGKLTETLSLALRYEYEFDNIYVNSDEKSEQRITTTLGYMF